MLDYAEILEEILPDGPIWYPAPDEGFDQFLQGMATGEQSLWDFLRDLAYVRDPYRTAVLSSLEREYPGGYVLAYVEGDGQDFDYGIDYIECASCTFLSAQGAPELAPYVCAVDKVASEMLGWGLRRTMTLAQGDERCDFRFKKGAETSVMMPESLR